MTISAVVPLLRPQMDWFRRPAALGSAVLIHVCLILALLQRVTMTAITGKETVLSLVPVTTRLPLSFPAAPAIQLQAPPDAIAVPPKIAIEEPGRPNDSGSNGKI
jgi:hypothetical protein